MHKTPWPIVESFNSAKRDGSRSFDQCGYVVTSVALHVYIKPLLVFKRQLLCNFSDYIHEYEVLHY